MTARTRTSAPAASAAPAAPQPWQDRGDGGPIAIAERPAIGTTARLVAWPPERLGRAASAVDLVLEALDRQANRFRPDSELSQINRSSSTFFLVSDGLAGALDAALGAARWTGGLVDPTVGAALEALGYDRDFAAIDEDAAGTAPPEVPVPGWSVVALTGRLLERPAGVLLDLGATAKGLGADRAAVAACSAIGSTGGVLVSLGGDLSVAGTPPRGGWPVAIVEDPERPDRSPAQVVRLAGGALATSSAKCRTWWRAGRRVHHLVDPRSGGPAEGPWRTATVGALDCLTANAASTAVMVGGADAARWLEETGLPARLVATDGTVHRYGGWPAVDQGTVDVARGNWLSLPGAAGGWRR